MKTVLPVLVIFLRTIILPKGYIFFGARLMLLFLPILGSSSIFGRSFYVSLKKGNDHRSLEEAQNPSTPWQSIAKINSLMSDFEPGDSILFHRDESFYGGLIITAGGNPELPIYFGSYGEGSNATITGLQSLSSWKNLGNGIYETDIPANLVKLNMVIINGINQAMGRYPNSDSNRKYFDIDQAQETWLTSSELTSENNWTGAQVVIRTTDWTFERRKVVDQEGDKIKYDTFTVYRPKNGFGFFLQNHLSTLDKFGEWYFDASRSKLYIVLDDVMSNVTIPTVDVLVSPQKDHIMIENLTFEGANQYGLFFDGYGMTDLKILNSRFNFSGIDAIHVVGWENLSVESCTITNSNNCALRLLGHDPNSSIRNNYISNTGLQAGMGGDGDGNYSALFTASKGLVAENNIIKNTGYLGIRFADEDILIRNNIVDSFCLTLDDGGGIYTYDSKGISSYDRRIIDNIVLNGIGAIEGTPKHYPAAEGIYLDDNTVDVEVSGNTVAHCNGKGIFIHNAQRLRITKNIVFNNQVQFATINDHLGGEILDLEVAQNTFCSKKIDQWTAYFRATKSKSVKNQGKFENNIFARPVDDTLTIMVEYQTDGGGIVRQPKTLTDWQNFSQQDLNSQKSLYHIDPVRSIKKTGSNQVENSDFDDHIIGTWCWSSVTDCYTSWLSASSLGSGILQVKGNGPAYLGMNCGSIDANRSYLLRFKAMAEKESNIEFFLQQSNWPWEYISIPRGIKLYPKPSSHEILITIPSSEEFASLQFGFDDQGVDYWFDNVELIPLQVRYNNIDTLIKFICNVLPKDTIIKLNGIYSDFTGNLFYNQVLIKSYQSKILFPIPAMDSTVEITDTTINIPLSESTDLQFKNESISISGSLDHEVMPPVKIRQGKYHSNFILYPNPVNGRRTINVEFTALTDGLCTIRIINLLGLENISKETDIRTGVNQLPIILDDLPPGVYYLSLQSNGQYFVAPFEIIN